MLVLKYNLTEEEYLDYNYFTAWTSPDKKRYRVRYYMQVMLLYIAVATLYIMANRGNNPVLDFSVFFGIGTVYFLLVPTLVKRSIRMKVKSILAEPENQHVLHASEVQLAAGGIVDRDTASDNRYNWDAIVRKAETRLCYYLYTNSFHAIVIPKRILAHDETEQLNKLLDENLSLGAHFTGRA
jgi:YcxB-like protein